MPRIDYIDVKTLPERVDLRRFVALIFIEKDED